MNPSIQAGLKRVIQAFGHRGPLNLKTVRNLSLQEYTFLRKKKKKKKRKKKKARSGLTRLQTKVQHRSNSVFLQPVPTSDPNDPLNWSPWRKTVNFFLVSLYVLLTFVALDIGFTAWAQYQDELGFDLETLNGSAAANYAGLAVGCIFFLPIAHKYGRRPLYILSTVAQLAGAIWMARTETVADIYLSNVLSGLGGAISEALVQVTIVDLFFVHQHATMNGWYLFATFVGAYLGPVASGYVVDNQGWRWMWWWCSILFGINLVLILLFFEESKYTGINTSDQHRLRYDPSVEPATNADNEKPATEFIERTTSNAPLDTTIKMKPYSKRLAWITPTKGHIWRHFYQPIIILFTFPAITYTAITYGSLLAWFALLISIQADYLIQPPYNFTAKGVGLMNLAPFIASIPGVAIGGYLSDRSILWLARRNNGIYEPEMRLWLALPAAIIVPASLLMFGLGLHNVRFSHFSLLPPNLYPD